MIKVTAVVSLALGLTACATAPAPTRNVPTQQLPASAARAVADPRRLIVDSAIAMLGEPYRYGGAAPGGFDCSGLVVYATGRAGLRLPRTAAEQSHVGRVVGKRELHSGDLVFMNLKHKELHVGIVIDDGRFVHAPSAGGHVRIDSLTAPPYARGVIDGRRIVASTLPPTLDSADSAGNALQ